MSNFLRTGAGVPAGGEFASHSRPEGDEITVSPDIKTGAGVVEETAAGYETVYRKPRGITETRAALRNLRGEPNGAIRKVELTWASVPPASDAGAFEVHGPKDGRPLIVTVQSGFPDLVVKSGHVLVIANSSAGHRIAFSDNARGSVVANFGKKVSVDVIGEAKITYVALARGWGSLRIADGAHVDYYGDPALHAVNGSSKWNGMVGVDTGYVTYHANADGPVA